ncbi:MAG: hypothetical protein AAFU71_01755 [Cyanobacteria bacterium J06632_22]
MILEPLDAVEWGFPPLDRVTLAIVSTVVFLERAMGFTRAAVGQRNRYP